MSEDTMTCMYTAGVEQAFENWGDTKILRCPPQFLRRALGGTSKNWGAPQQNFKRTK